METPLNHALWHLEVEVKVRQAGGDNTAWRRRRLEQ
jgi:hypothetical protein